MRRFADITFNLSVFIIFALVPVGVILPPGEAAAAGPAGPGWTIRSLAQPTNFSATSRAACENKRGEACDSYNVIVTNVGSLSASPGAVISDMLPKGVTAIAIEGFDLAISDRTPTLACSKTLLKCVDETAVPAGDTLLVQIDVIVENKLEEEGVSSVVNSVSVSGGGAPAVAAEGSTRIDSEAAPFGIESFAFQPFDSGGAFDAAAAGHPSALAVSLDLASDNKEVLGEVGGKIVYAPSEEVKDVIVDLPPGFVGNPQADSQVPLVCTSQGKR